jgi:hypothetical protein
MGAERRNIKTKPKYKGPPEKRKGTQGQALGHEALASSYSPQRSISSDLLLEVMIPISLRATSALRAAVLDSFEMETTQH